MYSNTRESQTYTFSPDLEDLRIDFNFTIQVTLPPNFENYVSQLHWILRILCPQN